VGLRKSLPRLIFHNKNLLSALTIWHPHGGPWQNERIFFRQPKKIFIRPNSFARSGLELEHSERFGFFSKTVPSICYTGVYESNEKASP
jgi:hypothetical protein